MIDFSKVRVGDKVLVEGTVTQNDHINDSQCPIRVEFLHINTTVSCWLNSKAITDHIPYTFKLGDEVKYAYNNSKIGRVIAVDSGQIWVRYNDGANCVFESSNLILHVPVKES